MGLELSANAFPLLKSATRRDQNGTGRLRTELAVGELVMMPLRMGHCGASNLLLQSPISNLNGDGSNSVYYGQVSGGAFGSTYFLRILFRGRVLGIRFDPAETDNSAPTYWKGLSVRIDDVAYRCPKPVWQPLHQSNFTEACGDYVSLIATDLRDGPHILRLSVLPGASATLTYVYGLAVERRVGYREPTQYSVMSTPTEVNAASFVGIFSGFSTIKTVPRGVRKLVYYNASVSTRTVTIKYMNVIIKTISMAAGASAEWDFNTPISLIGFNNYINAVNYMLHQADGASVYWSAIGS